MNASSTRSPRFADPDKPARRARERVWLRDRVAPVAWLLALPGWIGVLALVLDSLSWGRMRWTELLLFGVLALLPLVLRLWGRLRGHADLQVRSASQAARREQSEAFASKR